MPANRFEPGCFINPYYVVESALGQGGLGTVYLCRDIRKKSAVAVKVARSKNSGKQEDALRREFSLLSRLRHPNLAQVFDFGRLDDGREYIVQEYFPGQNLLDASARWSVGQILSAFSDLCRAVQFLHDRAVVHRDLKPSNVLYRGSPAEGGELKILDFGLAQFFGSPDSTVRGTLTYMAPEVLSGHRAGPRSDLYAMGVLLYQLLGRRLPFEDADPGYLIQKHLQGEVDLTPIERLEWGPALGRVVSALLCKNPEQRPVSGEEVVRLLDGATGLGLSDSAAYCGDLYFGPAALVGRDTELELLRQRAKQVTDSKRGWTVFITGETGSGKTRLMEELRIWGLLEGWRVVQGACIPNDRRFLGPYREIVESETYLEWSRTVPGFQNENEKASTQLLGEPAALQFRDRLARDLLSKLSGRPTIVLLHDFEWADETATVILDYLTSDILTHPVLLCVSVAHPDAEQRPVGRLTSQIPRQLRGEILHLGPLSSDSTVQLIAATIGSDELAKQLGSWITTSFGGNPLIIEETLKHLVDQCLLKREKGSWRLDERALEHVRPPDTVAATFRRRFSCLSKPARELAAWVATINRPVSASFLASLTPAHIPALDSTLEELVKKRILRASDGDDERTYLFSSTSMPQVITESLDPTQKKSMHRRIGAMLEAHGAARTAAETAMHLILGEARSEALGFALRAEAECKRESANDLTLFFAEYVLANGDSLSTERLCEVAADAADACCALGQPEKGVGLLERWLQVGAGVAPAIKARLLMQLGICYQHLGNLSALDRTCRSCLETLGHDCSEVGDATRAIALRTIAYAGAVRYRHREAVRHLSEALEALKRHDLVATPFGGRIHIMLAVAHWTDGSYRASIACARTAIQILTPLQTDTLLSQAYSITAVALVSLGKLGRAIETGELALRAAARSRSTIARVVAVAGLVDSLVRSGRVQEALARADELVGLAADIRNPVLVYEVHTGIAEARVISGDYAAARRLLNDLVSDCRPDLPVHSLAQVLYLTALLDSQLGRTEAVPDRLDRLKTIHQQQGPIFEYELGESLRASIAHSQGQKDEAWETLLEVNSRTRRLGRPYQACIVNLELAKVLLEEEQPDRGIPHADLAWKLARAMPSHLLAARACLLRSRLLRRIAERAGSPGGEPACKALLRKAAEAVEAGLSEAECTGVNDLLWQLHAEAGRVAELSTTAKQAAVHFRKAVEYLDRARELVPADEVTAFFAALGRKTTHQECEYRLSILEAEEARDARAALVSANYSGILLQMTKVLTSMPDRDRLLESMVDLLVTTLGMERVLVFLKEEGSDRLRLSKGRNIQKETVKRAEAISRTVLNDVYRQGQPFVTANARADPRVSTLQSVQAFQIGTLFCGPLRVGEHAIGVVYADHPSPLSDIGQAAIDIFAASCQLAAAALESGGFGRTRPTPPKKDERPRDETARLYTEIAGISQATQELRERIRTVASSPLDVLIFGESGTGKELVARALHRTSARSNGRFLAVDCGSLADSLIESEFFGYRKGAFTGAAEDRAGLLESANGGTLFLDEVTNLTFQMQAKLLRVLQEREVRRVGDPSARKVDLRILAATNCDLEKEVRDGRFRRDLYYRLNQIEIRIPALRDRQEDIPVIVERYLRETAQKANGPAKSFSPRALELLKRYAYPGNVRELINAVRRGYFTSPAEVIDFEHLPREIHRSIVEQSAVQHNAASDLYGAIRSEQGNFEDLVRRPFVERKLPRETVREILAQALEDSRGRYRDALTLLGVPDSDYHPTMAFLKRHGCLLDFRPFRKSRP